MKEIIDYLAKNMTAFQLWKIDKITDFKVWWFCRITMKLYLKRGINRNNNGSDSS